MITALENHLWQSTLFCCVAAVLTLMLRRNRAAVRHSLWLAASVKFLVPFSLLLSIGSQFEWREPPAAARPQVALVEQIGQPFTPPAPAPLLVSVPTASGRLTAILFGLWLCGFAAQGVAWWRCWRRVRSALRMASPLRLGLPIPAMSTTSRLEPGVFGIFRPVLILPEGMAEQLTTAQFESVLEHELCHARRHDNLTAAVHMLVEALFWFHPLVWLIRVRLLEERERACDEEVLQAAIHPQDYAEGIVAVFRYCLKSPQVCVSTITGSNLTRRVEGIMMNRSTYKLNFGRRLMLAAAGFAAVVFPLAVGAFHIPPVRAQQLAVPLEFDVVSVKPSNPNSTNGTVVSVAPGGRLHVVNATLKDLIETAYDIRSFQIEGGPKWAHDAKYDVEATPGSRAQSATVPPPEWTNVRFEVQALLKDRFQLQLHRETRTAPIYSLVIAKGGIRSTSLSASQRPQKGVNAGPRTMLGEAASMTQLAYKLSRLLERPVVNNTGLDGTYDLSLIGHQILALPSRMASLWTPPWAHPYSRLFKNNSDSASNRPGDRWTCLLSITRTNLRRIEKLEWSLDRPSLSADGLPSAEQLGLKLEPMGGAVPILIIDPIERPSEN